MTRSFATRIGALVFACVVYAVIALPVLSQASQVMS